MKRAFAFVLFVASALTLSYAAPALAQDKIDRPVKILVGFAAGGTADVMARVVADKMKDTLGVPVVVENRPGAVGRIAADAVKAAAPDGTTIMVMPIGPMVVVPHTYKTLSYDSIKDLATFAELGVKGVEAEGWFGFFAPAKTPKPIVDLLNRSLNQALKAPDVVERLTTLGMDPAPTTAEEFGRVVAADYAKWGPVVKASGFTAD